MSIETIKTAVTSLEEEMAKFTGGNTSAGARARKLLQDIKKDAQGLRIEVQTERKNRWAEAKKNKAAKPAK